MAGPLKTEAVVLRSIRYGEADRILHLYTPMRGRVGAIAKGVRRSRSRFGGRLEPFFRLDLGPARGPQRPAHGDERRDRRRLPAPARGRRRARRRGPRLRRGLAPVRRRPSPTRPSTTCSAAALSLLDERPAGRARRWSGAWPSGSSCCSRPASSPQLAACAQLRRGRAPGRLLAAPPAASSARACEAGSFPLDRGGAHASWSRRSARPLAEAPAGRRARRCARPTAPSLETLEHHAHVRLRAAA